MIGADERLLGMGIQARSLHYFAATVGSGAVAFAILPLTTRILGPPNYGEFALGVAVAGVGATLATLGAGFVINKRLPGATPELARSTVSTVALNALVIATAWATLISVVYFAVRGSWTPLAEIDAASFLLAVAATLLMPVWIVASDVLTLEGRSMVYAAIAVAQALVGAIATLVSLYVLDLVGVSLFVGLFVSNAVTCAGGIAVLRKHLSLRAERVSRKEFAHGRFLVSQVLESGHGLVERSLLSHAVGFGQLGLYTHSQAYRAYAFQATKAVSRGVWPVTLREAADPQSSFPQTRRVWSAVHLGVTMLGIAMTLVGYVLVGWLTNGKFVDAAEFLAPWFVLILLQSSARPAGGAIYVVASGHEVARIGMAANVTAVALAAALIPWLGIPGAVLAVLAQALVYRALLVLTVRRHRRVPFQDGWALFGIGLVTAAFLVQRYVDPDLAGRLLTIAVLELVCVCVGFRVVREVIRSIRWPTRPALASTSDTG